MSTQKRYHIIGTAGHVDHGKTELIRALTGTETDRLREEKERGISIDLGFAPFQLSDGSVAGVVDVPGHERFIHNMLAGISGIDLVLLVVDVQEGIMPQTREHLQILELLQVQRGIVVLTKCDLAEEEWVDIVEEEVREELQGSLLETSDILKVSAVTGSGLDGLKDAIEQTLAKVEPRNSQGPLRLPIDRHFSVAGFGTVVTGTLLSGTVRTGETAELLPPGLETRIREVQVHGQKVEIAAAGQRAALNLAGVDRKQLRRGAVIGAPGIFEQTQMIDVRLNLLPTAPRPLKFRDPVHFYLGTARVIGIVALLDRDELNPGETALVQIHLDRPLVAHRQDRFIIRSYSPMTTIGGGLIIDPKPAKHKRFRDQVMQTLNELESGEKSFLLQKIAELTCPKIKNLEQTSGLGRERIQDHLDELGADGTVTRLGDQWMATETVRSWEHILTERTREFHEKNPLLPGIPLATLKGALSPQLSQKGFDALFADLEKDGKFHRRLDTASLPEFIPQPTKRQQEKISAIEDVYRRAGPQAKNRTEMLDRLDVDPAEVNDLLGYLFSNGTLVKLNAENYFHRETFEFALTLLQEKFSDREFTLAEFRDEFGSARKAVQALLEYFDAQKYTMRKGDVRMAWKLPEKSV